MAIVVKDRVRVTFTTTGTADFTPGGATLGFQDFAIIGNGNETYYAAVDPITGDWEVGIGTYTTAGPTLTRTTILESSAAGAKVSFGAGSKDLFVTYPAERSVYLDTAGSYPVQSTFDTLTATTATLTNGTISTQPGSGTDIANKTYVDTVAAQSLTYHAPVYVESPSTAGNLNATYNQPGGPGVGVGATLTNNGTKAALVIDNVLMTTTKRVLIYNQTNAFENGVYTVTTVGTPDPGGTNWVLTRATDADTYAPADPDALGQGDAFFVTAGDTGAGELYACNTVGTITFGTTAITFVQISASIPYLAGTGLNLNPATTFNISDVGAAGTYGSSSNVPVFTTNGQGQVTSVTNTGIAITSAAVSGLAASATTDTTNASNISSGTLPTGRISGSYTGLTGTGALAAGSLATGFTAVTAPLGGTGLTSYAVGDLIYADTTTSFAKLADIAVGNALISGGVGSAPSYGKIGLATHVDGTLPVANGGTGVTSSTGTGSVVLSDSPTLVTPALGTPSALVGTNITGTAAGLSIGGSAGSAATLTTARTIAISGAVTGTATSFNGSTNITIPTTVNTTNGGIVYGASSTAYGTSSAGTAGYLLQSNGTGSPLWVENSLAAMPGAWVKKQVDCATTAALTFNAAQTTIDGVTISAASRVLVKNQAAPAENGIYTNVTTTTWVRADDASTSAELAAGTVGVTAGTSNGGELWTTSFKSTDTLGTTAMDWYRVFDQSIVAPVVNGGTGQTTYTNGQLLIGNTTGSTLVKATITAGTGISVTNGAGSITIAATNNGTVTSVTGTAPVVSSGGATPAISMAAATAAVNGYMTSTYAAKLDGIAAGATANTGTVTSVATSGAVNGLTLTGGTITTTGTITLGGSVTSVSTSGDFQMNSLGVGTAGSGTAGEIRATNNITAYYSDDRFKTNLGNIPDALAKVLTLNGFYYEANELAQSYGYEKKREVAVSAQQVQAVMPEVVAPAPIDENYLTVRYERLVPLLIEAIKELTTKVTVLEQTVAKLTKGT